MRSALSHPSEELDQSVESSHHEELLHEAVRSLLGLRQVMRLAIQEVRRELPASDQSREAAPGESLRGGAGGFGAGGFGETQFHILHFLSESPSLTVGEIANRCHVADPTISKMLNHLEANGLIERRVDKANRRVVRVLLTPAGRAAEAAMVARFEAALARVLSPLADAELGDLIGAFGHLQRLVGEPETGIVIEG